MASSFFTIFTNSQGELSNTQSIEIQDGEVTFIANKEGYKQTEKSSISTTLKADSINEIGDMVLETQTIEVTGTIRTELGKPISDTNVTILEVDSNQTTSIVTGEDGTYSYQTETGKKNSYSGLF
ncbi:MAG TPA: carboxypeptidase regulatory-like domain-containing protein [Campylobacterales bacterium]|nr:carboxypeptidase regulatory-like domain-containing protein [Campylobacterales bacterium]